jgi:hypothetical protein
VSRDREIVSAAAKQVKDPNTSDWLRVDREGTWEKMAAELLESTADKAASLDMTVAEVDAAIAGRLAFTALTAQVAYQKSNPRQKRGRRS